MKNTQPLTPVLLGADLCAYSVARAFHEYSGKGSYAFGRYRCGITQFSKIVKPYVYAGLDDFRIAGSAFFDFALKHRAERLFIVPCSDLYTELAASVAENFSDCYHTYLPRRDLRYILRDKALFYNLLEREGICYPKTKIIGYGENIIEKTAGFSYPAVVKPADSAEYWRYCSFSGMKKVYFPNSEEEARAICEKIYASGYRGRMLLQEKIGGEKPKISVLTVFFQEGVAVRAVYGRVILEEIGPTSHGNHAAIITDSLTPISKRLISVFESMGYCGFANFDIISDGKREYVLEVNLRQGRSCDYMRAAGVNIAELLTRAANGEKIEKMLECGKVYWHYPSHYTVSLLADSVDLKEAEELLSVGLSFSPLAYLPDIKASAVRRAYLAIHMRRLNKTFTRNAGRLR